MPAGPPGPIAGRHAERVIRPTDRHTTLIDHINDIFDCADASIGQTADHIGAAIGRWRSTTQLGHAPAAEGIDDS